MSLLQDNNNTFFSNKVDGVCAMHHLSVCVSSTIVFVESRLAAVLIILCASFKMMHDVIVLPLAIFNHSQNASAKIVGFGKYCK